MLSNSTGSFAGPGVVFWVSWSETVGGVGLDGGVGGVMVAAKAGVASVIAVSRTKALIAHLVLRQHSLSGANPRIPIS
jgi:hypothetical protein